MAPPEPSLPVPQLTSLDAGTPHAPLSWGYPTWNTPVAPHNPGHGPQHGPRASVKRALSESDDCDDVFSEESASKDQCSADGDEADSCQLLSRKKRRGVIEKRRRDRINTSLTELRRLVPSAFEKQGSAKLEKAEILQMTVDHLKMLHAKGMDALAYDPQRFAMDYHNIGFRECAAEVARYLVTVEGLDIQDPLRLRLMSHLQCFAAQRELASKQAASATWSYGASPTANYTTSTPVTSTPALNSSTHSFPTPPSSGHSSGGSLQHLDSSPTNSSTASSTHHHYELASKQAASATWSYGASPTANYTTSTPVTSTPALNSSTHSFPTPPSSGHSSGGSLQHLDSSPTNSSTASSTHHHYEQTPTSCDQTPTSSSSRHISSSPLTPLSSSSMTTGYPPASPSHPHPYYSSQYPYHQNAFNHGAAGAKPYRPWGAEVAY